MKAGHTQWAILWCLLVVPFHHLQRKDSLKSTDQSTSCRAVRKMLFYPPKQSAIQRLLPGRFNKKHKNESQILKSYKAINTIECFHILLCATFFAILLHYFLVCFFYSMVESMFAFQENNVFVVEVFQCSYVWFFLTHTSCEVTQITSASVFLLCTDLMTLKPCGFCSMCANRCSFFWGGAFVDSEIRVS